MKHSPEFDFVQHAFGLFVGHTYQGLLVNSDELISRPQTSILLREKTETEPSLMLSQAPHSKPTFLCCLIQLTLLNLLCPLPKASDLRVRANDQCIAYLCI